ncbi:MAG: biofilm synthesis protein PgaB, partial [Glaciihabitans sp.]|nr:biofilm synthesis protein PgaB [Glaciihabitans sp.]
ELVDLALSAYLAALKQLLGEFLAAGADADRSGIRSQLVRVCSTVGQEVRVELPGGITLVGSAIDLDLSGRLVVRRSADAVEQAVAAGDVTHLRYE